jgi:hypothetical protein
VYFCKVHTAAAPIYAKMIVKHKVVHGEKRFYELKKRVEQVEYPVNHVPKLSFLNFRREHTLLCSSDGGSSLSSKNAPLCLPFRSFAPAKSIFE